jgi:hypothetical protein
MHTDGLVDVVRRRGSGGETRQGMVSIGGFVITEISRRWVGRGLWGGRAEDTGVV